MKNDKEIDIEIQLSELKVWADRSLFYLAKMFTQQIRPGESYRVFKKCVSISILDFKLFQEDAAFYSCFHIREDTRNFLYTDKMELHVIELPKLPAMLKEDCTELELWAKFISAERKEDFDMLAQKNPYIESAYERLQIISQDSTKRLEYEAREKAIRDYNQGLLEAEERGEQRGIEIGEKRGIEIGTLQTLLNLVQDGTLPVSVGAQKAGMKESEFSKLLPPEKGGGDSLESDEFHE